MNSLRGVRNRGWLSRPRPLHGASFCPASPIGRTRSLVAAVVDRKILEITVGEALEHGCVLLVGKAQGDPALVDVAEDGRVAVDRVGVGRVVVAAVPEHERLRRDLDAGDRRVDDRLP